MTKRDWHYTDVIVDPAQRKRKRTIGNWRNYKNRTGEWAPTNLRFHRAEPDDSFFGMSLKWVTSDCPLEFFIGRPNEMGGRPWWGFRKSDTDADKGVIFFIENGVDAGNPTVTEGRQEVLFPGIFPDTDLILTSSTHFIEKWITLKTATSGDGATGNKVDLGIVLPDNWSLEVPDDNVVSNYIVIKNGSGKEIYRSRPAKAYDSSVKRKNVPCRFNKLANGDLNGVPYYRVRLRCEPAGFTRPIFMDPTVTISGAGAIEDNSLLVGDGEFVFSTMNTGGAIEWHLYNPTAAEGEARVVVRFDKTQIPAGTIDAGRLIMKVLAVSNASNASAYVLKDAAAWVEGTANFADQVGSSCWDTRTAAAWPGSAGAKTSGTDYDANASPPTFSTAAGTRTLALNTTAIAAWRDATRVNNGIVIGVGGSTVATLGSTENATSGNRPYVEIDYTEPVPPVVVSDGDGFVRQIASEDGLVTQIPDPGIPYSRD